MRILAHIYAVVMTIVFHIDKLLEIGVLYVAKLALKAAAGVLFLAKLACKLLFCGIRKSAADK